MEGIVLVCDRVDMRKEVNIFTTNLEFTSLAYFLLNIHETKYVYEFM